MAYPSSPSGNRSPDIDAMCIDGNLLITISYPSTQFTQTSRFFAYHWNLVHLGDAMRQIQQPISARLREARKPASTFSL